MLCSSHVGRTTRLSQGMECIQKIFEKYPNDPGLLVCILMQFHELKAGESLHVSPGVPHSYVSGLAIEVMTNSDNVLRMGLTTKPVNVAAALAVVTESTCEKELGDKQAGISKYSPQHAPFELIELHNAEIELGIGKYDVVLNLDGQVNVSVGGQDYGLEKGQAALLSSLESKVIVKGHAVVARSV